MGGLETCFEAIKKIQVKNQIYCFQMIFVEYLSRVWQKTVQLLKKEGFKLTIK